MSDRLEGGCFCRAVRYRLTGTPLIVHCCHCLNCQSQTGSAFVLNALVETRQLELSGAAPEPTELSSGSGRPHDVYRCAQCNNAVWSDYGRRPGIRFLRLGTLDDPRALQPDVHIYTRSKLPWVRLPEGVSSFDEFYDPKQVWSAESLERGRAANR
ncbi:MAG: GFA family protein [bacterium]|nr:GFA family protein [bacterium]